MCVLFIIFNEKIKWSTVHKDTKQYCLYDTNEGTFLCKTDSPRQKLKSWYLINNNIWNFYNWKWHFMRSTWLWLLSLPLKTLLNTCFIFISQEISKSSLPFFLTYLTTSVQLNAFIIYFLLFCNKTYCNLLYIVQHQCQVKVILVNLNVSSSGKVFKPILSPVIFSCHLLLYLSLCMYVSESFQFSPSTPNSCLCGLAITVFTCLSPFFLL